MVSLAPFVPSPRVPFEAEAKGNEPVDRSYGPWGDPEARPVVAGLPTSDLGKGARPVYRFVVKVGERRPPPVS